MRVRDKRKQQKEQKAPKSSDKQKVNNCFCLCAPSTVHDFIIAANGCRTKARNI